jgi:hypothetical protein
VAMRMRWIVKQGRAMGTGTIMGTAQAMRAIDRWSGTIDPTCTSFDHAA